MPPPSTPTAIYTFRDPTTQSLITYTFDPTLRDEDGSGAVTLERSVSPPSATPSPAALSPAPQPPEPGDEIYRYDAVDGGDVRYQFDPGSRNGKDYVVAVHRTPENWMRLGREDLGVRAVGSAGGRDGGGAREGVRTKMGTAEREREDVGGQAGTRAWWKRRDSGAEAEMDVG